MQQLLFTTQLAASTQLCCVVAHSNTQTLTKPNIVDSFFMCAAAAVLSKIATTLPDSEDGEGPASSQPGGGGLTAAQGPGGNSGYTAADALSNSGSGAVMAPAVMLADGIGRAVNSRIKYLRFKHHQKEWDAKEAQLQQQHRQQQQQQEMGEKLSSSLKRYSTANSKEAAEYAEGRSRLESYAALKSLRAASRKAANAALVSACCCWWCTARLVGGGGCLCYLLL
jgi:hypothetical protein